MIESSCVCGAVRLAITRAPDDLVDCNCSICRRYGALWAYYPLKDVIVPGGLTDTFLRGPKKIEFHRCKTCGCVTHWLPTDQRDEMGVNARLMEPEVVARARVRHLDGAN
ncbi:MAG: GFA family protein, partial [Candidatus Binatus sp.]|uniref:GFA family protein n=1 Tax=Candidatus Binatus sp. TaxID=2811406 RepID=UPI003BB1A60C